MRIKDSPTNILKNLLKIFLLSILLSGNAFAKVKSKDINFPGKYYTKEIKSCSAIPRDKSFSNKSTIDIVRSVVGFDWSAYHEKYSNSILVEHAAITKPIKVMIAGTHIAIGDKNRTNINTAKSLLIEIAKANTLHNSISYKELQKKGKCWKDNNPEAPCWYHEYEFAGQWFGNYMISAVMLKSELNKEEFKIVNNYIKKMSKY